MSPSPLDRPPAGLAEVLRTAPEKLEFLPRLDPLAQERLAELVSSAVERDTRELDEAVERAVRFIPRPFRGRARRILVPEDDR